MQRILGEEGGQVLPWVALVMLVVLGMAALSVDLGRAMVIRRQLQVQADAAALAAVENISNTDFSTVGQGYSGAGVNAEKGINVGTPTITGLCLTTVVGWNIPCNSAGYNAVQVTETATIPTLFAQLLGRPTLTISATSTASPGRLKPYNIALILDTTPSMSDTDSSCNDETQLQCAVVGIQGLLKGLDPTMDNVSLFTFPNLYTTDVSNEYNCAGTNRLTVPPYTFPIAGASTMSTMPYTTTTTTTVITGYTGSGKNKKPVYGTQTTTNTAYATYQIVDYSTDYKTSDTATTLDTSSDLVKAVGGKSGCSSMGTGNENTYYAGAIYAAQSSLIAEQAANPGTLNAMILLSDGNATAKENNPGGAFLAGSNDMVTGTQSTNIATAGGSYASWVGQCGQAVDAAQAASKAGTMIYTIAYGSPTTSDSGDCYSDVKGGSHVGITPCQTLQDMSTNYTTGDTSHFFSDYNFGGGSPCKASGANSGTTAIADIYKWIVADLSGARLIPNGTP
ncbi:MAG TPA: pilus assembly protein TadG-related protein [Acidobacteriaceae bacterium]|nr:pilus assembly protein TadG-related protein [Acidobacteriaceae bacterium]